MLTNFRKYVNWLSTILHKIIISFPYIELQKLIDKNESSSTSFNNYEATTGLWDFS